MAAPQPAHGCCTHHGRERRKPKTGSLAQRCELSVARLVQCPQPIQRRPRFEQRDRRIGSHRRAEREEHSDRYKPARASRPSEAYLFHASPMISSMPLWLRIVACNRARARGSAITDLNPRPVP